jgi:hypothetical protein
LKYTRLIHSLIAKSIDTGGNCLRAFGLRIIAISLAIIVPLFPVSIAHAAFYYFVLSTKGGTPAFVKLEYNSRFACQDWLGYCIPNDGYPKEMPFGACGETGIGVGLDGNVGTSCGHDSSSFPSKWTYFFYPSDGGIYGQNFGDPATCGAALRHAKKNDHPPKPKFADMTGTFSSHCVFSGQAFE